MSEATAQTPINVLIVDDDPAVLRALTRLLAREAGFVCSGTQDPLEAITLAAEQTPDVVLSDISMPGMNGLELLSQLKARTPSCEVVLMTGFGSVEIAVRAVKAGAYDFLVKPFGDPAVGELAIRKAADHKRLRFRAERLEAELAARDRFEGIVGSSPAMRRIYKLIETVAHSDASVLIEGESGTGKELVARALHFRGPRKDGPFLAVNCAALPTGLAESELFGHARGAFTGAVAAKKGFFEAAHRGTLFLDEIADLPPSVQVQLLRVLQDGEVRRVGENTSVKTDVRVIAATNIDLGRARAEGKFREDLYYRLNVVSVQVPALRERTDDIPALAQHFLQKHSARHGTKVTRLGSDALALLLQYRWPGNVRELENAIERASLLAQGQEITPGDLPRELGGGRATLTQAPPAAEGLDYAEAKRRAIQAFEQHYLGTLLRENKGNISAAARRAGMGRANFRRLLKAHGVDKNQG